MEGKGKTEKEKGYKIRKGAGENSLARGKEKEGRKGDRGEEKDVEGKGKTVERKR